MFSYFIKNIPFLQESRLRHSTNKTYSGFASTCVRIAPNVSWHHNKHLMRYFKFLLGSRIIYIPFNIPENLYWQYLFQKPEEAETHSLYLSQYNTIATHAEEQHPPFSQKGTTTIFSFGCQSCACHVMVYSVDKTHVLVVTVELIWLLFLNMLSFNFISAPNKSLLGWQD